MHVRELFTHCQEDHDSHLVYRNYDHPDHPDAGNLMRRPKRRRDDRVSQQPEWKAEHERRQLSILRHLHQLREINIATLQSVPKVPIDHNFEGNFLSSLRCVQKFDHHCMWINNCIGEKNYNHFMAMTVVTFLNLAVYIIGMVLLWTENEWELYLGSMVTVWVYSFLVGVFAILLLNLIGLHFYLISKDITTYQFIIMQREQQAKKKQEQLQARQENNNSNMPVAIISGSLHQTNISNQRVQNNSGSNERIVSVGARVHNNPSVNHTSTKHENTNEVIFGMSAQENEIQNNRTQKSDQINDQNGEISRKNNQDLDNYQNQNDDPSSMGSKAENHENISNYFTKNKSLKFFIGDEIGSRPKSTKNAEIVSRDKLFRSARAIQMQPKKQALHQSENKYRQKSISLQVKQQKPAQKIQVLQYQQKRLITK